MTAPAVRGAAPGEAAGARQVPPRRRPGDEPSAARGRVRPRHRPRLPRRRLGRSRCSPSPTTPASLPTCERPGCETIPDGVAEDLNESLRLAAAEAARRWPAAIPGRSVRRPAGAVGPATSTQPSPARRDHGCGVRRRPRRSRDDALHRAVRRVLAAVRPRLARLPTSAPERSRSLGRCSRCARTSTTPRPWPRPSRLGVGAHTRLALV